MEELRRCDLGEIWVAGESGGWGFAGLVLILFLITGPSLLIDTERYLSHPFPPRNRTADDVLC